MPDGTVPIAIAHYYDSFSGWGEFTNPQKTPSEFCATYVQHSHNVTRVVSFDVLYGLKTLPEGLALPPHEAETLGRLKSGERLSLSGSDRNIHGNFLQAAVSQLKDSQALKTKGLEVDGAEFSDDASITKAAVPFSIHLQVRLTKSFSVQDARFDGSLVIEDGNFDGNFQFQNTAVKEDLILNAKPSAAAETSVFGMRDTRVEGRTEITSATSGSIDNLKTGDLHVIAGATLGLLNFAHLDVNSIRVDGTATRTGIRESYATNSKINNSLRVAGIDVENFRTNWTTVGELILANTAITKGLDLSFSTINSLEWAMGQARQRSS